MIIALVLSCCGDVLFHSVFGLLLQVVGIFGCFCDMLDFSFSNSMPFPVKCKEEDLLRIGLRNVDQGISRAVESDLN